MSVLYIVQGFLGAGKTTWSTEFARKAKATRLNADEYCAANFPQAQLDTDWDNCFAKAVSTLWDDAGERLKRGEDVILDFGFWTKESRDHARGKALDWKVELQLYFVTAPDEVLIERIGRRGGEIARRNIANFQHYKTFFEAPSPAENAIVIDTSVK